MPVGLSDPTTISCPSYDLKVSLSSHKTETYRVPRHCDLKTSRLKALLRVADKSEILHCLRETEYIDEVHIFWCMPGFIVS